MTPALKLVAAALATFACLATTVVAHGSEGRSTIAIARATASAELFCTDLQKTTRAEGTRFSGWRCKQGPVIRGVPTILAWVKLTRLGDKAHLFLIWLGDTRPVVDALVIDALKVPHYGYEPGNVQHAFQVAGV